MPQDNSSEIRIRPIGPDFYHFRCLHQGPTNAERSMTPPENEQAKNLFHQLRSQGRFFDVVKMSRNLCRTYNSCGMLAWHGKMVIGHLRFFPAEIITRTPGGNLCLQDSDTGPVITKLADAQLKPKEQLSNQALSIHCLQVCPDYRRQGVARRLVESLMNWAAKEHWSHIRTRAIRKFGPLLEWVGSGPVDMYRQLGFDIISKYSDDHLAQALQNMKAGHHGEKVAGEVNNLPEEALIHLTTIYEMTRALG